MKATAIKADHISLWTFQAMGLALIVAALMCFAVAWQLQQVAPDAYFHIATVFFAGSCFTCGGFHLKRLCLLSGAFGLLSLFCVDLAQWTAGTRTVSNILVTWTVIAAIVALGISRITIRSRKSH